MLIRIVKWGVLLHKELLIVMIIPTILTHDYVF